MLQQTIKFSGSLSMGLMSSIEPNVFHLRYYRLLGLLLRSFLPIPYDILGGGFDGFEFTFRKIVLMQVFV